MFWPSVYMVAYTSSKKSSVVFRTFPTFCFQIHERLSEYPTKLTKIKPLPRENLLNICNMSMVQSG